MSAIPHLFKSADVIRQSQAGECGLACIAMVAASHGMDVGLTRLRQLFPISARGASLKVLIDIADKLGFHTRGIRSEIAGLTNVTLPALLHWDLNHYVVLKAIKRTRGKTYYHILDPALGSRVLADSEFSNHFTGIVLELAPSERFAKEDQRARLRLTQLWSHSAGLSLSIFKIFVLSLIMQLVALVAPLQMQFSIDSVIASQDGDLAFVLLVGFLGLWIIGTISTFVRTRLVLNASTAISFQTAVNLFRHTIFLPVSWFEKRHLGDVVSRFTSLQPITDLLTKGVASAFVDGLLSLVTFSLMFVYSPLLATVSAVAVVVYAGTRLLSYNISRAANVDVLSAQAQESSSFIESIRGINAIKLFCQEGNRQRLWQNKKSEFVAASLRIGRITSGFDAINSSIVALEAVTFVFLATKMVIAGSITLGMVFAFQAFKQSFMGAMTRIVDQAVAYRLLDVHLERISDLAFATPEIEEEKDFSESQERFSEVQLSHIGFRYGPDTSFILADLSFSIEAGKTYAIVGPSGIGKTTFMKVLSCLLEPTVGTIFVDKIPVQHYGVRKFRNQLGVVSQEDSLFAGSIAENISFFDLEYDHAWMEECCKKAAIYEDIRRLPMGFETLIGDMGSTLSGGQKQRVLLARALYKRPSMLLMDEGTAHLDVKVERLVANSIKELGITRVLVAHRFETIMLADVILSLEGGRLRDVTQEMRNVEQRMPTELVPI